MSAMTARIVLAVLITAGVLLLVVLLIVLGNRAVAPAGERVIATAAASTSTSSTTSTTQRPTTTTTTTVTPERPAAVARTAPMRRPVIRAAQAGAVVDGAWSCGGDLPPCWVMHRENPDRDLTVYNGRSHHEPGYSGGNPEGDSTASGKWQFLRSTWGGFGGFLNAADAPWQVQDEKARALWAGGDGCAHWSAC